MKRKQRAAAAKNRKTTTAHRMGSASVEIQSIRIVQLCVRAIYYPWVVKTSLLDRASSRTFPTTCRPGRWAKPHKLSQPFTPYVSKKIAVINSPWGRSHERPSDCQRWIQQGHAFMNGIALEFTLRFVESITREFLERDPDGFDDGVPRRWVNRDSSRTSVKQLCLVKYVGTGKGVHKIRDGLMRRQSRRDKGRSLFTIKFVINANLQAVHSSRLPEPAAVSHSCE